MKGPDHVGGWVKFHPRQRAALAILSFEAECAWFKLYMYCAGVGNDGRMPVAELHVAMDRKVSPAKASKLVDELVQHGFLEHDGDVVVLDWSEQPTAEEWNDPVKRERWARLKRLHRDTELTNRIKDRDRNLCRYCGIRVNWNNKVGKTGGTYDHVDPDGTNSIDNVVVSCRRCNGRKRDRTPEQAGMTLLRPGTTAAQAETARCRGSTPGQPSADSGLSPPSRARARPDRVDPGLTRGQPDPRTEGGSGQRARAQPTPEGVSAPPHDDHDWKGDGDG